MKNIPGDTGVVGVVEFSLGVTAVVDEDEATSAWPFSNAF